ncbi:GNAT family N-acetyltransferase [Candidatus Protochlamydia phocaeensis]|uniref:GNAT family N-acetyltransferase n=1 Tax=Candidatus Protochlamydia phocaeensis TaxID=1414722 RepID=UPI000838F7BC|nr:GNAT family N-acetyltransferase [Candidatus Protochlamydia phocaeensis]
MSTVIQTERLILRPWCEEDIHSFARLNADPRVMEFFPAVKSEHETKEEYCRIQEHFAKYGWGFWAVSLREEPAFIGFIGLRFVDFIAPFTPTIEIGWKLAFDHWGKGYAPEGACAALDYAFEKLHANEVVSFTAVPNIRSRSVMKKIGMVHDPEGDFDHPKLSDGHWLKRHILYRITHQAWQKRKKTHS